MRLGERSGISYKARAVLHLLADNTTVEGLTFVKAETISGCAGVGIGEVEGLLAELVDAGHLTNLTRHGDGFRLQVVEKAGLG